jgi:hypothetical protein
LSRHLKYMARARIFEFESHHPSHAVWSLSAITRLRQPPFNPCGLIQTLTGWRSQGWLGVQCSTGDGAISSRGQVQELLAKKHHPSRPAQQHRLEGERTKTAIAEQRKFSALLKMLGGGVDLQPHGTEITGVG